jgi:hypothetical protein
MMGRRLASLGPSVAEALVTSGLGAVREDGNLLADDLFRGYDQQARGY